MTANEDNHLNVYTAFEIHNKWEEYNKKNINFVTLVEYESLLSHHKKVLEEIRRVMLNGDVCFYPEFQDRQCVKFRKWFDAQLNAHADSNNNNIKTCGYRAKVINDRQSLGDATTPQFPLFNHKEIKFKRGE